MRILLQFTPRRHNVRYVTYLVSDCYREIHDFDLFPGGMRQEMTYFIDFTHSRVEFIVRTVIHLERRPCW
ncbi:hypothetical protein Y032_0081g1481 [Ancylostoma ceylanicum]|uniref:Uncharacterized protein n=1 Tax=Ancylostoma ceylanicum TaxID=53326 RepID=A0A016TSA5_9BILA|nr:hypothetical protein Y032_0081g1481 [Ancylostoma ceylanicum]